MKKLMIRVTVMLAILCVIGNCHGTESKHKSPGQEWAVSTMKKHANEFLAKPLITSVSIGVYKDGKAYTGHFGELTKGQDDTATDQTIYEIASVTKTFTGTLAAQAVLDGKLTLQDDIRVHLEGSYPNLEFEGKPILVQHLLTYTAGFPALPLTNTLWGGRWGT